MVVFYMKFLWGIGNIFIDGFYKLFFFIDQELKYLILEVVDGFLFIVLCEIGRVVYVFDFVIFVLNQLQFEWFGSIFYDQVYLDDVDKFCEQFFILENVLIGCILDLKIGIVKKEG